MHVRHDRLKICLFVSMYSYTTTPYSIQYIYSTRTYIHVTNCKRPRRKHITHIKQLVKRNYCPRQKGLTLTPTTKPAKTRGTVTLYHDMCMYVCVYIWNNNTTLVPLVCCRVVETLGSKKW